MAGAVRDEIAGATRHLDRVLRAVEDHIHSIRQKLLARQLADTLPAEEWALGHSAETELTADDLRNRAAQARSDRRE